MRALRVIDFSRTAISTSPKCVGNFKLLKVLNLSNTQIAEVPDCVRRLKSLQFIDVSYCGSLQRVPDWVVDLKSLPHIRRASWQPCAEGNITGLESEDAAFNLLSTRY
ncbi:hypothetical protein SUGI_0363210 [Cryptomeria japonica]|nr:hypothetical protein SUGI_0363210 [Cryptomeria japonica]